MPAYDLNRLFAPRGIAVLGASDRPDSIGTKVFQNLTLTGFKGGLYPVNPKHKRVQHRRCFPDIEAIGKPVDLAVIASPARTVPEIIYQCAEVGVRTAIVLSAGFGETGDQGSRIQDEMVEAGRRNNVRILGPNCLGVIRPPIQMNASFASVGAALGHLALVSQSGALCSAILDWAASRGIGFSAVVCLGAAADLGFGDILDYLALDPHTRAILLYVEGIRNARNFISGLRTAARMKPVIAVKAGRHLGGPRAAVSHTGALVGSDDVFDAALQRAGAVRAETIDELFAAAQLLATGRRMSGNRIAVITNGGGPGVLASDRAADLGLLLAQLSSATCLALEQTLPKHWSRGNPIDVLGDAGPDRYRAATAASVKDAGVDGVLVMLAPQAMSAPVESAQAVIDVSKESKKPVLTAWLGQDQVVDARRLFGEAQIPQFASPEAAIEAFGYLAAYRSNQELLLQVPGPLSERSEPDVEGARLIIEGALSDGRRHLSPMEAKAILRAFHIPTTAVMEAHDPAEALVAAETIGLPVAMKVSSPDIPHKSEIGGVRLNIQDPKAVRTAFRDLLERVRRERPEAHVRGVTLEAMHRSPHGRELFIRVIHDEAFGPAITFGAGGVAIEILRDRAVALPPLNDFLIKRMIEGTHVERLLSGYRRLPAVDPKGLITILLRVSEMVCELPQIQELDINPLVADENSVIALDAYMSIGLANLSADPYGHMAIYPYPSHLASRWQLADGTDLEIRPIRPEDAKIEKEFVESLSAESKYFRFMQSLEKLTPAMLVRLTQIDYDREMALIAVAELNGQELEVGVVRYAINPDGRSCEFALTVADAWQNKGIGTHLMRRIMEIAKTRGLQTIEGEVLASNNRMLDLVRALGFGIHTDPDDPAIKIVRRTL